MLYEKKSVSPQEFDEVKARYQAAQARRDMARSGQAQAKAALQQARTALGYTHILAPFDGIVTEKKADVGTLASPGMPIFTVEDLRRYRLEATVNESDLRYVRQGQQVPVVIDALGDKELKGRVVEIVPAADAASRSFLVKIEVPSDPALRSGLFGRAHFTRGERSALLIPSAAVVQRGQLQGIYVLDQNKIAGLRYIILGKPTTGQVEVLAGLQAGEMLIGDPGSRELSGKKIEARRSGETDHPLSTIIHTTKRASPPSFAWLDESRTLSSIPNSLRSSSSLLCSGAPLPSSRLRAKRSRKLWFQCSTSLCRCPARIVAKRWPSASACRWRSFSAKFPASNTSTRSAIRA